jgi:glycosyltransferase involved in cell wall biosynthesis
MPANISINTRILNYRITGAQRYLREILPRLPQERITAIAPASWHAGFRGHLWEQCALPLRIAKGSLLWSPSITGPLAVAKQVITIFDVVPLDHPEWFRSVFSAGIRRLVPMLARRARHIIAISEFTKSRIVALCGVPPERITVTLLAADARFSPAAADPARVAALGLPTPRYLLTLGSIEPRKNIPLLIEAWRTIVDKVPKDISLVVAGGTGNSAIFGDVALGTLPERVHFTGHVPDAQLPALLAGALGFCYPSLYEGFGLPPLEAMACGVPVLTGSQTSLPEVVGDAGLMVDPSSRQAIADGLLRLAGDDALRAQLRERGLARNRLFSWDAAAARTWEILEAAAQD